MHVPWGASSFYLKHYFVVIIRVSFTWYFLFWMILWEWWFHVCALDTPMQIVYFEHKPWELPHIIQSTLLDLIIISIFHLVSFWFIWLLTSFVELSWLCYLFAIFDPHYSVVPSEYSSLDMCIWFHSHYEKCTPYGETLTILTSLDFCTHFGNGCQWGRSLEGLRKLGFMLISLCLSICLSCFASCCLAWLNI